MRSGIGRSLQDRQAHCSLPPQPIDRHNLKELEKMKAQTLLTKAAAGLGTVALALAMSACSHNTTLAESAGQTTGEIRTEQTAQQQPTSSGKILGTAPAPANAQGTTASGTPAYIHGPPPVYPASLVYTTAPAATPVNPSPTTS